MILKDLLKVLAPSQLVNIERTDGSPIITTRAHSWSCLDDGLLAVPVGSFGRSDLAHDGALEIKLATEWPIVYVSTAEELQAALDDDEIRAIALAADITADDDVDTLITFNSVQIKSLDLNGYLLAASNNNTGECVTALKVIGGGTLNIYDSEECGEIFGAKYGMANYAVFVDENSMVNIYSGYFSAASMGEDSVRSAAVKVISGVANIYGGYFENDSFNYGDGHDVLSGNVVCYGGVVSSQDPIDFVAQGKRLEISQRFYNRIYRVVGK